MMIATIYGIAISAFNHRFKGEKIKASHLLYEIRMIMSIVILLPTALIHSVIANLRKTPGADFT